MKYLILGLLLGQHQTLYDLHRRFAEGLSHLYAASYGRLHRALRQLNASGEVAVVEDADTSRHKIAYRATSQGRQTWLEWMGQPRANEDSEATMLARVFLLGLLDGTDQRREVLLALRRRAVSDLEELKDLGDKLTDRRDEPGESPYPRAALH